MVFEKANNMFWQHIHIFLRATILDNTNSAGAGAGAIAGTEASIVVKACWLDAVKLIGFKPCTAWSFGL